MKEQRQKVILGVLLGVWAMVAAWAWSAFPSRPPGGNAVPPETTEITYFLEDGATPDMHLEWLDRGEPVAAATRDLFSTAPLAGPAEDPTAAVAADAVLAPAPPPLIAAALRYMGYVQTSGGTLALLREGSQMYLAGEGHRVGPGYLVAIVDATFVEIEYRGERRRLPVSGQEGATNGQSR